MRTHRPLSPVSRALLLGEPMGLPERQRSVLWAYMRECEATDPLRYAKVVLNEPFATPEYSVKALPMRVDHVHFPVYSAIHDMAVAMKRAAVPGPTNSYLCEVRVSDEAFNALCTEHEVCGSATIFGRRGDESFIIIHFPKFNLPDVLVFSESPQ